MPLDAVLSIARRQINTYVPQGVRSTFSAYWGGPAQAWCADFACWALKQAGALDVPYSASTIVLARNYRRAGRFGYEPRVGALAFFHWPGLNDPINHVAIVESVRRSSGHIVTLEGNTSNHRAGSQWNGGQVLRKVRSTSLVVGYGYPSYTGNVRQQVGQVIRKIVRPSNPRPTIRLGAKGQPVLNVQHALNVAGNHLHEDGDFGPGTDAVVKKFQANRHMVADGVVGPATWAALGKVVHG